MAVAYTKSMETQRNGEITQRKIYTHDGRESMEFVNTEFHSYKFVNVLNNFEGSSEVEVQRHFEKAFFDYSMADKQRIDLNTALPMRARKLPASFWHQDMTSLSHVYPMTSSLNTAHQYPDGLQIIYTSDTVIGYNLATQPVRYADAMNSIPPPVTSRLITYTQMPMSGLSASAQNAALMHNQVKDRPRCSVVNSTAVQYVHGPRVGHGFNPRYNFMLIQPDVKPALPLIHGQQRENGCRG